MRNILRYFYRNKNPVQEPEERPERKNYKKRDYGKFLEGLYKKVGPTNLRCGGGRMGGFEKSLFVHSLFDDKSIDFWNKFVLVCYSGEEFYGRYSTKKIYNIPNALKGALVRGDDISLCVSKELLDELNKLPFCIYEHFGLRDDEPDISLDDFPLLENG